MVYIEPEFEPAHIPDSEKYEGTEVDPSIFSREYLAESKRTIKFTEQPTSIAKRLEGPMVIHAWVKFLGYQPQDYR